MAGIVDLFLTVLCPTLCSIGVGIMACGTRVLTPQSGFFQLGVNAVIVGVLVWMARRWPARRFLAAGGVMVLALTGLSAGAGPQIMLHTGVLTVMWVGVVLLNVKVLSRCGWARAAGQYLAWSLSFAVGLFGAGAVLMILLGPAETASHLGFYGQLAALTGIGLGIGFKVRDWLIHPSSCGPDDKGSI